MGSRVSFLKRPDSYLIPLFIAAFALYLYSFQSLLIGILMAILSGTFTFFISIYSRTSRMRSVLVITLTVIMWTAFIFFLVRMGPALASWIERHIRVPLVPTLTSGIGYATFICPFLLLQSIGKSSTGIGLQTMFLVEFPPALRTFLVILAVYLGVALVVGKGWCGWLCPFGGLGEVFINVRGLKKIHAAIQQRFQKLSSFNRLVTHPSMVSQRVFDIKYSILLLTFLLMFVYSVQWFCVFCWAGILSWFVSPVNIIIFLAIFLAFFVALPLLSGMKWCHFICPLGAALSLLDKVTPFKLKVDEKRCTACYACLKICPTLAIRKTGKGDIKIADTCDKCLICTEKCPAHAIELKISGLNFNGRILLAVMTILVGLIWFHWFAVAIFRMVGLL